MKKVKTTGEIIRELREKLGMSQTELARRCEMGNVSICRIETGVLRRGPHIGTLKKIAKVLRVKLQDIV